MSATEVVCFDCDKCGSLYDPRSYTTLKACFEAADACCSPSLRVKCVGCKGDAPFLLKRVTPSGIDAVCTQCNETFKAVYAFKKGKLVLDHE